MEYGHQVSGGKMIYQHKKTGQKLQIKEDGGDIVSCYVLDDNLNKIRIRSSGCNYKTTVCQKNNLVEAIQ